MHMTLSCQHVLSANTRRPIWHIKGCKNAQKGVSIRGTVTVRVKNAILTALGAENAVLPLVLCLLRHLQMARFEGLLGP